MSIHTILSGPGSRRDAREELHRHVPREAGCVARTGCGTVPSPREPEFTHHDVSTRRGWAASGGHPGDGPGQSSPVPASDGFPIITDAPGNQSGLERGVEALSVSSAPWPTKEY